MKAAAFVLGVLAGVVGLGVLTPGVRTIVNAANPDLERGRAVYEANCAICHGAKGDGNARIAEQFRRRPQSFVAGKFKFRSTPSGSLPLDEDLLRSITQGIARTGMVPQDHLDEADRRAVISYIKTFSPRFQTERPRAPIPIPLPPRLTPELAARGRELYVQAGCQDCHGASAKGDGPSAGQLKDDWEQQILRSDLNLTRTPRRSGPDLSDLYRTIATGLGGTPMPSYADALKPGEIWAIVAYLNALPIETEWAGLPEGKGAELVRWRCTVCHQTDGANLPRQDLEGWTKTVDMMIRWGAPLRPDERDVVIRYLAEHFGPKRSP